MVTPARGAIVTDGTGRSSAENLVMDIYDKTGQRVGRIQTPSDITIVERRLGVSSASVVLSSNPDIERYVGLLRQPGARVHFRDGNGYVLGGPVVSRTLSRASETLTVAVEDYMRVFMRVLGWPMPTAALSGQTREYYRAIGTEESVVKQIARANFSRLSLPVIVEADQGRGRKILVEARMDKLSDVLFEDLERGRLDLRMRPLGTDQRMTGLSFDVVAPVDYPVVINEDSDILADYTLTDDEPTSTRVVLGGGGEGVLRDFFSSVDIGRETERGGIIAVGEDFVDGRNLRTDYDAALDQERRAVEEVRDRTIDAKDAVVERRTTQVEGRQDVAEDQRRVDQDNTAANRERLAATQARANQNNQEAIRRADEAAGNLRDAQDALAAARRLSATELAAYRSEVADAMAEALDEGGPKVAASITLSETASFQWDNDVVQIGTRLRFNLAGVEISERIRERQRVYSSAGLESTPVLGQREASPDVRLARAIATIAKRQRAQSAR